MNSNKEKAVKLDMNLKNHFAGDVCAAVKRRGVGKDEAGGRSRAGEIRVRRQRISVLLFAQDKNTGERERRLKTRGVTTPGGAGLESCPL